MFTFKKIIVYIVILSIISIPCYFLWKKFIQKESAKRAANSKAVNIPKEILSNKFGFVTGGLDSFKNINDYGANWIRPRPGPFSFDAMEPTEDSNIFFEDTDKLVKEAQANNLTIIATIWPFADWDQLMKDDPAKCKVSENDEFLPKNNDKTGSNYLPFYRCAPNNWKMYEDFLAVLVERYDGDGAADMPGLKIPIKYWEVANEPDLPAKEDGRLVFWKDTPQKYAEFLVRTTKTIKKADYNAKVLIAGAAGGTNQSLNFYREVFKNPETLTAFDFGNVHSTSSDTNNDLNVSIYKRMLEENNLTQSIWVTEAENMAGKTFDENARLTKERTLRAFSAGAEKIIYTRFNFSNSPDTIKKSQEIFQGMLTSP